MPQPKIMTVQEVADLLRVSERTVYDWATNGQIPCGKLATGKKSIPVPIISMRDILSPDHIVIFNAASKREALQHLIDTLSTNSAVVNADELAEGIYHREELMSTGIGLGVAVPHVRLRSIKKPVMAVGINKSDITDYQSLDGKPVRILFMILAGIGQHVEHIKTLDKKSSFIKEDELRNSLLNANDPKSIFNMLITKAI